jgi:hypothetical protein
MGDGDMTPRQGGTIQSCRRCSSVMDLLTRLPATSENPAYRIFGCTACHFVEWIAEQIAGERP